MEPIKPLFVVGAGRSGTTLLQQMLDHHPAFAFPWESHFIPDFHRHRDRFGDLSDAARRAAMLRAIVRYCRVIWRGRVADGWETPILDSADALAAAAEPTFAGTIDAFFGHFAAQRGKPRWADKTPGYVNSMRLIHEIFPSARFIHLVRDGRDVACSVMPLSFGPNSVYMCAHRWKHTIRHATGFEHEHPDRVLTLRYEDLTEDPESHLRRVCAFLDVEYFEQMLDYHRDGGSRVPGSGIHDRIGKPVNRQRCGRWKNEMSGRQVRIFEAVAGGTLEQFGYERACPGARLHALDKRIGKIADTLLYFRPFTRPDSLAARLRQRAELATFRWE